MGHWDEHVAMQSFINEAVVNSGNPLINNDLVAFFLGVAQHEIYDLLVNERPINLSRIDFGKMNILKEERATIYVNIMGIGLGLWTAFGKYSQEKDKAKLRKRLLGVLGAVTPDILEGLRLIVLPDGKEAWQKGDASLFHLKKQNEGFLIDTFNQPRQDLQRRLLLQKLVLSAQLFKIEW